MFPLLLYMDVVERIMYFFLVARIPPTIGEDPRILSLQAPIDVYPEKS
jgi:hypothetical protein